MRTGAGSRRACTAPPMLSDDRGAPRCPQGMAGSISHKEDLAVALVAAGGRGEGRGGRRDGPAAHRLDIARKVLRDEELAELATLSGRRGRGSEVILRFSAKEAMYKALDPFVRRYVGFREVAVTPLRGRNGGGPHVARAGRGAVRRRGALDVARGADRDDGAGPVGQEWPAVTRRTFASNVSTGTFTVR